MSLGQIIRNKREQLSLTLDEVSHRTGYSKPYLSTIETGRVRNPPADELLVKLEELLQFESGMLVHIAHIEKRKRSRQNHWSCSKAVHRIKTTQAYVKGLFLLFMTFLMSKIL